MFFLCPLPSLAAPTSDGDDGDDDDDDDDDDDVCSGPSHKSDYNVVNVGMTGQDIIYSHTIYSGL